MHSGVDSLASVDASEAYIQVAIDNDLDADCTVITIEGQDQSHLLMSLAGAITTAGLSVVSATITSVDGRVLDVFRVQGADGKKVRMHALCLTTTEGLLRLTTAACMYIYEKPGCRLRLLLTFG